MGHNKCILESDNKDINGHNKDSKKDVCFPISVNYI